MHFRKTISRRLLLAAIFVGLNALCFLGVKHGPRAAHHTRVDYSHVTAHSGRGSRGQRSELMEADSHADHAVISHQPQVRLVQSAATGPSVPFAPPVFAAGAAELKLPHPDEVSVLLPVSENVMALGSAPRAPGLGRAPPAA